MKHGYFDVPSDVLQTASALFDIFSMIHREQKWQLLVCSLDTTKNFPNLSDFSTIWPWMWQISQCIVLNEYTFILLMNSNLRNIFWRSCQNYGQIVEKLLKIGQFFVVSNEHIINGNFSFCLDIFPPPERSQCI